jgi:paraquat-inducible protein B
MNEENGSSRNPSSTPEAIVKTKKSFSFSLVWLVPVVAALIGGWLVYKALSEKGPTITITFQTAEGLEAGKTKIKYKDVEVGQVESIELSKDLSHVIVTAELVKGAAKHLTENTRFWVVRARVAAGEVSGLGTLFAGAYIGIDPGKPGKKARSFKGLEFPPIITAGLPGRHFVLRAERLGSLDVGSPVLYRQIKVGQVVAYELEKNGKHVDIKIFIHGPHHEVVRENTRFWNASGLDVAVDAGGIRVNTESFVTMMFGGIAFDTPVSLESGAQAKEDHVFKLYESREKIYEKQYVTKRYWLLYFDGSVRGLSVGAPVEFRGIQIGEVVDVKLELDPVELALRIPVLVEYEPERITWIRMPKGDMDRKRRMEILVERGLRAQLKTGSLITGQLLVEFDFHPDAPPAKINWEGKYPEIPTVPTPMQEITTGLARIVNKVDNIPLEQIGKDLQGTMANLNKTSAELQKLVQKLDDNVAPAATATLEQAQTTLIKVDKLLNAESPTGYELKRALGELADAGRNLGILADYLERHPESLVYGKGKGNEK